MVSNCYMEQKGKKVMFNVLFFVYRQKKSVGGSNQQD